MASCPVLPESRDSKPQTTRPEAKISRSGCWQDTPLKPLARISLLVALTLLSIVVHGYHMGTDDAAIYAPGIEKAADPSLFPSGSDFFMHHAGLSLFPRLVAAVTWLTHLPIEWSMLLWFTLSQFLLLWAAYELARLCFRRERSRWAGVGLLAALLNVPVAGTALIIADSYLTARSLSTPLVLISAVCFQEKRTRAACLWLLVAFLIHPQMAIYGIGLGLSMALNSWSGVRARVPAEAPLFSALLIPFLIQLQPAQGAYREVLATRAYFLVTTWHWWEWLGAVAPLAILAVCVNRPSKATLPAFSRLAKALIVLGLISIAAGLLLASDNDFAYLLRLQPMRSFHLIYVVFFVLLGGLAGEYLLRARVWRWILCFGALSAAMFAVDLNDYPDSPHIERPGVHYQGDWLASFLWIRDHTPKNAVFAIDPEYLSKPGVDLHGFRAIAERSVLADQEKDSGAASVFPDLAEQWKQESSAQSDWSHVSEDRLQVLQAQYGVTWVLLENSAPVGGVICPYRNRDLRVCRIVEEQPQLLGQVSRETGIPSAVKERRPHSLVIGR